MPDATGPGGATPAATTTDGRGTGNGAPATPPATSQDPPATGAANGTGTGAGEPLGAPGLAALQAERDRADQAERARREAETALRNATTEQDRALAAARLEARNEVLGEANQRLVRAEIIATAAGRFADPNGIADLLNPALFLTPGGEIRQAAITEAIDKLAAAAAATRPPAGNGDGGARSGPVSAFSMNDTIRRLAGKG
jgi:hypothetical protein